MDWGCQNDPGGTDLALSRTHHADRCSLLGALGWQLLARRVFGGPAGVRRTADHARGWNAGNLPHWTHALGSGVKGAQRSSQKNHMQTRARRNGVFHVSSCRGRDPEFRKHRAPYTEAKLDPAALG